MNRNEPTHHMRRLGEVLRELRRRAGLSQQEAADRLNYDHRKISRIEKGQKPDYHGMRAMLDTYGVPFSQWEPYMEMYSRALEKGWWTKYDVEDQGYISLEHDASKVCDYQVTYVPGLLQTPDYIRAVLAGARVQRSKRWIANQVEVRLLRQERLLGGEPLELRAIMLESALAQASRAQLVHLEERRRLPNVTVQVLPHRAGFNEGQFGAFTVLDFPAKADRSVLYVEHAAGSLHVEDPSKVKVARLNFTHLSKLAMSPAESAEWLGRLSAER
ncbi:helix-turn-helix transcriptional regulator [Actinosynnema sp. NPDC023658]|uniref:helix-turn-helix domain-containing protein n=1 Tax=Actinosynnema sp. NPDC023658 TaxID=3155465 RepID=UPI00340D2AA2